MSLNWNRPTAVVVEATFISVGLVLFALPIGMLADLFGEQVTAAEEAVGDVLVEEGGELLGDVVDDAQAAARRVSSMASMGARRMSSAQPVGGARGA
jgi:hypothetical protein